MRWWQKSEREACRWLGLPRLGGPGRPDGGDGVWIAEVKARQRPVTAPELRRLVARPWVDRPVRVVSASGFTAPAEDFADRSKRVVKPLDGRSNVDVGRALGTPTR